MQLTNEFVVPRGIDETWAVLTNLELIAPAMPGAQLTGVEDGKYNGRVKIKVGPVTAAYAGVASFRQLDVDTHHVVLDAAGKESNGRGRASAVVTADLTQDGAETKVTVTTDLTISGPLAQFGRGAIADVSTRLLNQFVANLKESVLANGAGDALVSADAVPADSLPAGASSDDASLAAGPDSLASSDSLGVPDSLVGPESLVGLDSLAGSDSVAAPDSVTDSISSAGPAAAPKSTVEPSSAAQNEVNLLKIAAWPILKRVIPLVIVVAAVIALILWLA